MSRRDEQGAATLLVVAFAGLLLLLGCALGVVAAMIAAHRTAQAAADLAALAGAEHVAGRGSGCTAAADIARSNGAHLTRCLVEGRDVTVTVRVAGPRWLGQEADLSARARAGPG